MVYLFRYKAEGRQVTNIISRNLGTKVDWLCETRDIREFSRNNNLSTFYSYTMLSLEKKELEDQGTKFEELLYISILVAH